MNQVIRILIADDHAIVREGLRALIATEPGLELVAEAADGVEAVDKTRAMKPDAILPEPRKADVMAEELHTMLVNARVQSPYILAGHSLGGPVARQFAAKYSDEVAGLVMVGSAHEQKVKYVHERLVKMLTSVMGMMSVMKWMGRIGIIALDPRMVPVGDQS